ncbi:MAG: glycosyltransferase [Acidimicrobiales bacterium]
MEKTGPDGAAVQSVRYVSWGGLHGYPTAAVGYLGAMMAAGVEVGWDLVVPDGRGGWCLARSRRRARRVACLDAIEGIDRAALHRAIGRSVAADLEILHVVPELWPKLRAGAGPVVGNTVWETDRLPRHWPRLLNATDGVIVPSVFNRDVFRDCGVTVPLSVVPHIAAPAPSSAGSREAVAFRRRHRIAEGHRIVYMIEAWTARKAPWRAIRAFVRAFDGDDGVTMVVKGPVKAQSSAVDHRSTGVAAQIEAIRSTVRSPPPVVLVTGDVTDREIQILHGIGDCYLSMSHGEGWGLSVFEAAASGNPVVTTGWGGTLEYLGERYPLLVDFDLVNVVDVVGASSFSPDQRWASADIDHAGDLLRRVIEDPGAAAGECVSATGDLRGRFSQEAVTPALLSALDVVARR